MEIGLTKSRFLSELQRRVMYGFVNIADFEIAL